MGMTRKLMSISTLGLVDMRSDKERTAAYTRGARKQARNQTKLMRQQPVVQVAAPVVVTAPPPGFYADPAGARLLRWWDGTSWTVHTQPMP